MRTTKKLLALLILLSLNIPVFSQAPVVFGREECERTEANASSTDQKETLDWMQCVSQSIEINSGTQLNELVKTELIRKASRKTNDKENEAAVQLKSEKQN